MYLSLSRWYTEFKEKTKKRLLVIFGVLVLILVGVWVVWTSTSGPAVMSEVEHTIDLKIPDGALPDGITPEDVHAIPVTMDEIPEEWRWLGGNFAFRLEPDGLVLKEPITAIMTAPAESDQIPYVYLVSNRGGEQLHDVEIAFDPVTHTVSAIAQVSHFSWTIMEIPRADGRGYKTFEYGDKGLNFLASLELDKNPQYQECIETRQIMKQLCQTYENWHVSWRISGIDFLDKEKEFLVEGVETGPNKCGLRAGETYPIHVTSKFFEWKKSKTDFIDPNKDKSIQITCDAGCQGWTCPAGERDLEQTYTCREGTYRGNDCFDKCPHCTRDFTQYYCWACNPCRLGDPLDLCETNCGLRGGTCRETNKYPGCYLCYPKETPSPIPPPPPPPTCDFDGYIKCRDKFNLQGCIDACPYVPITCPPGTPPNTDCKETDRGCSDACWDRGNTHGAQCAKDNNCTLNEIDARLRQM